MSWDRVRSDLRGQGGMRCELRRVVQDTQMEQQGLTKVFRILAGCTIRKGVGEILVPRNDDEQESRRVCQCLTSVQFNQTVSPPAPLGVTSEAAADHIWLSAKARKYGAATHRCVVKLALSMEDMEHHYSGTFHTAKMLRLQC